MYLDFFMCKQLIDDDRGIRVSVGIEPGCFVLLHVDAAVAAIIVEGVGTGGVIVWELRARAEVVAPPCIVDEEATPVIEDRIVNRCIGIPVG